MDSKKLFVYAAACLLISGCGSSMDDDCSSKMDHLRNSQGQPQEVITFSSGDHHSETWWYYSRGFAKTFTWESGNYGSCDVSDFTFNPI